MQTYQSDGRASSRKLFREGLIIMENNRGQWGSNFGFLMAAVGSAVGLGNIWGFPSKMGANGGFAFLLIYLLLVVIAGFATMLGELTLGRKYGRGAVGTYKLISKKYTWMGYMGVASGFLILSFYSVLGGLVLRYMVTFLMDMFTGGNAVPGFGDAIVDPASMLIYYAIFMVVTIAIVMGGISGGIEKFSRIAMPALAIMLVIVIIRGVTLPGAEAGLAFMFAPNFAPLQENFFGVLTTAAGQMFFSLSLGMGCMITYGSYLSKKENLEKSAIIIPIADTIMALMAGLAVLPAVGAFGLDFGGGPGLLFVTMKEVFQVGMGGFVGNLFGFIFFFLVFVAAVTSSISLLEVCAAYSIDKKIEKGEEPDRKKMVSMLGVIIFFVGLPVALDGLGGGGVVPTPWALFGLESAPVAAIASWLDFYDFLSEGVMMPLGALVMSLVIGYGLKTKAIQGEVEATPGVKMKGLTFWDICFRFLTPAVMLLVLYGQIMTFLG